MCSQKKSALWCLAFGTEKHGIFLCAFCVCYLCLRVPAMQVIFLLAWGGGNLSDMQDLLEFYRDSVYQCSTLTLYSDLYN